MNNKNGGFIEIHVNGKAMLIAVSTIGIVCDNVIALNDDYEINIEADESYEEIKRQLV